VSTLDDYVAKARAALDQLRPPLDELRGQADVAQSEARDRLRAGIASVQKAQADAKAQLDQAAHSGQGTWKSTARQAEQTLNDVGAQLQTLIDQVQGNVGAAAPAARKAWAAFREEWSRGRTERAHLLDEG
jgi:hypothetical protein